MSRGIGKTIVWDGASAVRVRGGGVAQDGFKLQDIAETFLHSWLAERFSDMDDVDISLQRVGKQDTLVVPRGKLKLRARMPAGGRDRQRMSVWVDVDVDGELFQTVPIWFAVSVITPVRVANRYLQKSQPLDTGDWTFERRNIAGLPDKPLLGELPKNPWLLGTVYSDSVLSVDSVAERPPVREGEIITVLASHGNVSVAVKGVALTNGNLSERVRVESPSSGKTYTAMVAGEGLARVQ